MVNTINYSELAQEVKTRAEVLPETAIDHKEITSAILREQAQVIAPTYQPQPMVVPQQKADTQQTNLPTYSKDTPLEIKNVVENLIKLTLEKGLNDGITAALACNDPFLLDLYHDSLTDKLVSEMKARKML
jgi:hypothetical protein